MDPHAQGSALVKSLLIFLGAGLGGNARYWIGWWLTNRVTPHFPLGTVFVNITGSLLIGIVMTLALKDHWHVNWRIFLTVGVLGGYTTFSTFSHDTLTLMHAKSYHLAMLNIIASVVLSLLACWAGMAATKSWVG